MIPKRRFVLYKFLPVLLRVLVPTLGILLLNGCATRALLSATEYRHNRVTRQEWKIGKIQEAYEGPKQQVLLKINAQAPKKRSEELHHVILPFGQLAEAVKQGEIVQLESLDSELYPVLFSPDNRQAEDLTPLRIRYALPRHYGLYGRPGPQSFPLRIARGTLKAGGPEEIVSFDEDWQPVPVIHFEHPVIESCAWHNLQTLDPPVEHRMAVYQGFSHSPPMAFALVSADPIHGHNYSLAFHKPDPEFDHAWYQKPWIVLFRVFVPVTVALDVVTAPVQIPLYIYAINNLQLF